MKRQRTYRRIAALAIAVAVPIHSAYAQAMPWEGPLNKLLNTMSGTTARLVLALAAVAVGIAFANSEAGGVARKALGWVFGGAIALNALAFVGTVFGG